MARINLLPWRDDRRQIRKREFWTQMAVAAGLSVVAVYGGMMFMDRQLAAQEERNAYLNTQIAELDKKIVEIKELENRKAKLLKKKEIIENLQADRSMMVHLFEQMARTIPDGVALTGIKQQADVITLDGKAQSEARVAAYMRSMEDSPYLKDSDLNIVETPDLPKPTTTPGAPAVDLRGGGYRKKFALKISVDRPKDLTVLPSDAPVESTAPATGASPAEAPAVTPAATPGANS
jgi:type IV pilus assembly protein PilN